MRVVRHWWNGSWGRLNRRDILLKTDGERWELETRLGGVEGKIKHFPVPDEAKALEVAQRWMSDGPFRWSDITTTR